MPNKGVDEYIISSWSLSAIAEPPIQLYTKELVAQFKAIGKVSPSLLEGHDLTQTV